MKRMRRWSTINKLHDSFKSFKLFEKKKKTRREAEGGWDTVCKIKEVKLGQFIEKMVFQYKEGEQPVQLCHTTPQGTREGAGQLNYGRVPRKVKPMTPLLGAEPSACKYQGKHAVTSQRGRRYIEYASSYASMECSRFLQVEDEWFIKMILQKCFKALFPCFLQIHPQATPWRQPPWWGSASHERWAVLVTGVSGECVCV